MGKHKPNSKRIQQGLDTKRRIMDCAAVLFKERGYHQVTVDEVVACAKSSKGSFYTHFTSKEELVVNMVELVDEIYAGFQLDTGTGQPILDLAFSFVEFVFKTIEGPVGIDSMSVLYSFQIRDPQSPRLELTPERKFYQVCYTLIEQAKEREEIDPTLSTDHVIRVIATGIRGAVYDWCLYRGQFELVPYGNEIISRLLNSFRR